MSLSFIFIALDMVNFLNMHVIFEFVCFNKQILIPAFSNYRHLNLFITDLDYEFITGWLQENSDPHFGTRLSGPCCGECG